MDGSKQKETTIKITVPVEELEKLLSREAQALQPVSEDSDAHASSDQTEVLSRLKECLTELGENDIVKEARVTEKLREMKKLNEKVAAHHVWQGNDGKWHTHFYIGGKRKKKTRNKYEDIMADVKEYYSAMMDNPTINELFHEWIEAKLRRGEIIKSTADKYKRDFKRNYGPIKDVHIKNITEYDIEEFVLDSIYENNLKKKAYEGLRTVLYGIFKLAKRKRYITFSIRGIVGDIEIPKKAFADCTDDTDKLSFTDEEKERMENVVKNDPEIVSLGVILNFRLGLRIGELAALRWRDVDLKNYVVHINSTETSYTDPETGKRVYEVRDGVKTNAGKRDVMLSDSAVTILKAIRKINPFAEFVFEKNGKRVRTYVFRQRLYRICDLADVDRKPTHSIRRTCATEMIDSGLMREGQVASQLGHVDISITRNFYYQDRSTAEERRQAVNGVFG